MGYWFSGWYRSYSTIPGGTLGYAGAQVEEYNPFISGASGDTTSSWVLISNESGSPPSWSQVGWIKYTDGARYGFSEWTNASGQWFRQHRGAWPEGNHTLYEVYWDPNSQRLQHWVNHNLVFDHIRYFTMRRASIYGETHNYRSQMPGGFQDHVNFTGAYVANLGGGVYTFDGTPVITDGSVHGLAKGSSTHLDIWDRHCAF